MDYLKVAVLAAIGTVMYFAILSRYPSGTADFFGLLYVLLAIRTYQVLDVVWDRVGSLAA